MDFSEIFPASRSGQTKRYATRLVAWTVKTGICWVWNEKKIGATAIITPPSQPKEKNGKQSEKKAQKEGEERTRTQSPGNSAIHPFTPIKRKKKKGKEKEAKTGKRGLEPAHLASYCCKQCTLLIPLL